MDDYPERWLLKAVAEDPGRRDAVVDLVDLYVEPGAAGPRRAGWRRGRCRCGCGPGDYMTAAHTWDDERLVRVLDGA